MVCCCSLAGTVACYNCPQYIKHFGEGHLPKEFKVNVPYIKTKKVIERFDKDGNLIERITEE